MWTAIIARTALDDCLNFPMVDLLHLPIEIRMMIWSLLLPRHTTFESAQRKQRKDFARSAAMTIREADDQRKPATVVSRLLLLSPLTFGEGADTFYSTNTFCFDIRDTDSIKSQSRIARSSINHIRLVDRLSYTLPAMSIKRLLSLFCSLKSVSVPTYPEPFPTSSFDINLQHRAINLSKIRGLVEHLEEGYYEQLFLNYNQPCSPERENLDQLLTLRLLRRLQSDEHYVNNRKIHLWLDIFVAWIYSFPSKRSKILKVLERLDPTYDRGFLACLVETEVQSSYTRGFTIALSMPKRLPPR